MLNKVIFTLCFASSGYIRGQTNIWEDAALNSLPIYINDVNTHLKPLLSAKERLILDKIKVSIDNSTKDYAANSDSDNRTIMLSSALIRAIVRFTVAQFIDVDKVNFDRKRFAGFYTSAYPFLSNNVAPEVAAELNTTQIELLNKTGNTKEFSWKAREKIMFVYLHELGHQIQDYSKQLRDIEKQSISKERKDSILLRLEIEADLFATDKIARMDIDPTECEDVLTFLGLVREKRFATVQQITERQLTFFAFCYENFGCDKSTDELCSKIKSRYNDFMKLSKHYKLLLDPVNLKSIKINSLKNSDIHSIYNLADFYFKGTSEHISNLDSAMKYYKIAADLKIVPGKLYGANNKNQLIGIVEYCQLMTGKIYELKQNDKKKAIAYYEGAMKTSMFMSKQYYTQLILRLKK